MNRCRYIDVQGRCKKDVWKEGAEYCIPHDLVDQIIYDGEGREEELHIIEAASVEVQEQAIRLALVTKYHIEADREMLTWIRELFAYAAAYKGEK
jgi:hypothetical protein